MIQADLPSINLEDELDTIMKTQTNMGGLFTTPQLASKFMRHYKGYKFEIKLPRRCDTPEMKEKITQFVTDRFGWNIFKFV